MRSHRTTARGVLLLALVAGLTAPAAAARPGHAPRAPGHQLVFPVVGPARYADDFGDPRGSRRHEGNDILAPRRALAVAAESGTVKFWTSSWSAGCMLYLRGDSGATYMYIHLNNDLTDGNDNRGRCVPGTAYANGLSDGDRVEAGEPIGFVGDSGDADGTTHLHFEVHPGGGVAVDPYRYLRAAQPLLFAAPRGSKVSLALTGTVVSADERTIALRVDELQAWPARLRLTGVERTLVLAVSDAAALAGPRRGQAVVVRTAPAPATLEAERGDDGALTAASVQLAA